MPIMVIAIESGIILAKAPKWVLLFVSLLHSVLK